MTGQGKHRTEVEAEIDVFQREYKWCVLIGQK